MIYLYWSWEQRAQRKTRLMTLQLGLCLQNVKLSRFVSVTPLYQLGPYCAIVQVCRYATKSSWDTKGIAVIQQIVNGKFFETLQTTAFHIPVKCTFQKCLDVLHIVVVFVTDKFSFSADTIAVAKFPLLKIGSEDHYNNFTKAVDEKRKKDEEMFRTVKRLG